MNKLGIAMMVAAILIGVSSMIIAFIQSGEIAKAIATLVVFLFWGGGIILITKNMI